MVWRLKTRGLRRELCDSCREIASGLVPAAWKMNLVTIPTRFRVQGLGSMRQSNRFEDSQKSGTLSNILPGPLKHVEL